MNDNARIILDIADAYERRDMLKSSVLHLRTEARQLENKITSIEHGIAASVDGLMPVLEDREPCVIQLAARSFVLYWDGETLSRLSVAGLFTFNEESQNGEQEDDFQ